MLNNLAQDYGDHPVGGPPVLSTEEWRHWSAVAKAAEQRERRRLLASLGQLEAMDLDRNTQAFVREMRDAISAEEVTNFQRKALSILRVIHGIRNVRGTQ